MSDPLDIPHSEPSERFDIRVAGVGAMIVPLTGDITMTPTDTLLKLAKQSIRSGEAVSIVGQDQTGTYLWDGFPAVLNKLDARKLDD